MLVVAIESKADTSLKAGDDEVSQDNHLGYLVIVWRDVVLVDGITGLSDADSTRALSDKRAFKGRRRKVRKLGLH